MDDTCQAFDRHAFRYQDRWGDDPVAQIMRSVVHATLDRHAPPGSQVLDAGCGIGLDTAWLSTHGRQVVALDASAEMAAHAAQTAPAAVVHHLSALDAPALHTRFDAALLNFGVLNCLPLADAAAALAAVLRPGGRLVLAPMPRLNPAWMLHRLRHGHPGEALRRLRRTLPVDVEGIAVPTRYLSGPEIIAALRPWFVLREQQSLGLLLPPPDSRPAARHLRWAARIEAPLRSLPLLRQAGDHLLMVFERRPPPTPPADAGPLRRRWWTRAAQHDGHVRRLRTLVLEVTRGCQSACQSCDHRGPAGGEALTPDRAGALAAEAHDRGARDALITGGEPLLRPDLEALLAAVHGAGLEPHLLTNGLALARHADMVARWCPRVVLSFDAPDAADYLRIRGVDGFAAVVRGVAALRQRAPAVRIDARTTVTALNAGRLHAVAQAALEAGIDGISFLAADLDSDEAFGRTAADSGGGGGGGLRPDPVALRAELAALRDALPPGFVTDSDVALARVWQKYAADAGQRAHTPPRCDAPWTSAVVGADLSVRPCFFLPTAASAVAGLEPALAAMAPALRRLRVDQEPTCARCVCWARLT